MYLKEDSITNAYDKASFKNYKNYISKSGGEVYAVYAVVDNIKHIRDFYGLLTGDSCIVLTAARLKKVTDLVFRVRDAEFVLFIFKDEELKRLEDAKKLIPTLYFENGKNVLNVSVGISDKAGTADVEMLIEKARERAKVQAK
ncbi:MAG: diguanylate cyclase [Firmicutes bacterium]|nr:diguanylate cyclase [Bacillota bacterium]